MNAKVKKLNKELDATLVAGFVSTVNGAGLATNGLLDPTTTQTVLLATTGDDVLDGATLKALKATGHLVTGDGELFTGDPMAEGVEFWIKVTA